MHTNYLNIIVNRVNRNNFGVCYIRVAIISYISGVLSNNVSMPFLSVFGDVNLECR